MALRAGTGSRPRVTLEILSIKVVISVETVYQEIDAVIAKMQAALEEKREQHPDHYAKYPMQLMTTAEDQALRSVTGTWSLPEEYLYFLKHYVPESVSWSTDEYMNMDIYGAKDLLQGQSGYNYNHVTDEVIADWPRDYLVIASDEGDPYCIDLSRGDTVIYTAAHGAGSWDFSVAYDNLLEFLHSMLRPASTGEWEDGADEPYDYCHVYITGPGTDKIKTWVFIKKRFSCDYAQAKTYLEAAPLLVYKGLDSGAVKLVDELKSIGADYELRQISQDEFLGIGSYRS
ncbi:SMI1/KNR4 family protein [Paenibacillus mucilaginosus]|uniref:SMI1/KNR4 family protein n=1 Tax=Paenibacillus mucilaginosus TaxID=61624 RepID=UPI0005A0E7A4|nr:SMI1/KNR4 family protein [Paenibacillus mucilaginosus]WDM30849.1 SMI1/KNR4 family protein [Paenibacillus mucilaginosus]